MIFNELPTVFTFYDKLEKQHRYRQVAEGSCFYNLITPRNALLPFQFKTGYNFNDDIFDRETVFKEGYKLGQDGEIVEDESHIITDFIEVDKYSEIKVRSIAGFSIKFYDENKENIEVVSLPQPPITSWTSYQEFNISEAIKYVVVQVSKEESKWPANKLFFSIIGPDSEMNDISVGSISDFKIISIAGQQANVNTPENILKIHKLEYEDGVRFIYKGDRLTNKVTDHPTGRGNVELNLGAGKYYAKITLTTGEEFFSEVFTVPQGEPTKEEADEKYTKFTFWNSGDLKPLIYNKAEEWKQVFYTEAECYTSNPIYEEEGERDVNDELIPTFKKLIINWTLTDFVPDYLKIALTSMQMHSDVQIKTGHREGRANRIAVEIGEEDSYGMSSITINIEQDIISQRSCDNNINKVPSDILNFIN